MGEQRKKYSEEFKKEAVELALSPDKQVTQVARELGVNRTVLYRWISEYKQKGEKAFPGNGKQKLTPQEEENLALKKELEEVREERDILKKAMAVFSKNPK